MTAPTISGTVRAILSENLELTADEVIKKAKARGLTASDDSIRGSVHNIKSDLKKAKAKPAGKPVPAAAQNTAPKKPAAPKPVAKPAPAAKPADKPAPDLKGVFTNVALVNKVVDAAGGVDQARQVAIAVKACGSVEAFLQHLELVAGIRTPLTPPAG